jgi:hypothetical protein
VKRGTIVLTALIAVLAAVAAGAGIVSNAGSGPFEHESIRGAAVTLHGRGIYRHMSSEVAPQGIAQDYVTLFLAVPLLLWSAAWARRGPLAGRVLLAGTLGYFFVTYLFYLMMAMYNVLFLVYVALLSTSFFALASVSTELDAAQLEARLHGLPTTRRTGVFLVVTAGTIALLWSSIVVPPLLSGAVIPVQVEHYTTLVVQGLDLALLLPLGIVAGVQLLRQRPIGYLVGPIYLVFLALLTTALTAKVLAMGGLGYEIVPAVFIIPAFNVVAAFLAARVLAALTPAPSAVSGVRRAA